MRIKNIHIYGYGKMKDVTFSNIGNLHVFYGVNEAGKSTIMSFIHSILFGFPLKTQADNRYEPKEHSTYGGKLNLVTDTYGEVSVQRLKGKATGDVTVTFSDGQVGGEEALKSILQGLDKSTYQSIFSFDLNGLAGLQKLSEDEVSRYLLSAGLLGSDQLLTTEQRLQKDMDQLFKPSGKNPKLNILLTNVKQSFDHLSQAMKEQDQYENLLEEYKQLERDKSQLEEEITELDRNIASSYNYQAAKPLLVEATHIRHKLNDIEDVSVPLDAEERYQQLKQAKLPIETEMQSLKHQQALLEEKENKVQVDLRLWQDKERVQRALEQTTLLDNLTYDLQNIEHNLQEKNNSIQQLKDYVHITLSEEEIKSLDSSSFKKERVLLLEKKQQKLQHDKQYLDEKQDNEQRVLKALEQRICHLMDSVLNREQRQSLQEQVDYDKNQNQRDVERKYVEKAIEAKEKQIARTKRSEVSKGKNFSLVMMASMLGCFIATLLLIFMKQWVLAAVFGCLTGIVFILKNMLKPTSLLPELEKELQELQQNLADLKGERGSSSSSEIEQAKFLLQRDDEVRQQLHNEKIKKAEHEATFHKIVDEFEQWEQATMQLKQAVAELLQEWSIPQHRTSTIMLTSLYETITALKQHIYEKQHLVEKARELSEKIESIKDTLFSYCQLYADSTTDSYQEAVILMRKKLANVEQAMLETKQNNEAKQAIHERLTNVQFQLQHVEQQLHKLFNESHCDNEDQYMQALQMWKEKTALQEKYELLQIQLKPYEQEMKKWEQDDYLVNDYTIHTLEKQKQVSNQNRNQVTERLAEVKHSIQVLEEGGTFDEQSFQYMSERSALDVEAKEWMKYALAKSMLNKAVNKYKNTKFPKILQTAEQYMVTITDGEYVGLKWIEHDGGLMLQRKDGIVFEAKEVSRGTQEAIYVALRLSLAEQSFTDESMPIIIDDSFVNFDSRRVENVIDILRSLQSEHQIIFFTCHDYLLSSFEDASITRLKAYN
ncbi:ATP-binding protein [Bacillus massiliigorillae]|uniref:ATP-binding protein n=1 Tax=Bacillus massiliigorillae TaxID=1243664 RepID=UPI0003A09C37|nr:AAA family ATPase [Bacillus massiliigorillae]